uniref:Photosystem II reaction center protein Z n=1 Tax=Trachelomonas volvocina TaxID=103340 RepID=A0A0G3VPU3_9EUGL|nr:photosystem II protein Z [Trachelomonas volvocina]AKL82418.1 photosystem II protein Z [Trachelomonas volvocina]
MLLFTLQASVLALIVLSFLLVIGVPVTFASPNGWNENKSFIFLGTTVWTLLVLVIGGLNYFVI